MHPTDGRITQEVFAENQASGQEFAHTGRDYGVDRGAEVRTIADGTVIFAGSGPVPQWLADRFMLIPGSTNGGNYVFIQHDGWVEYFGHLDSIQVGTGARVRRGQRIGGAGDSGAAQGVHLHYEVIQEPCPAVFPWGRYHPQAQIDLEDLLAKGNGDMPSAKEFWDHEIAAPSDPKRKFKAHQWVSEGNEKAGKALAAAERTEAVVNGLVDSLLNVRIQDPDNPERSYPFKEWITRANIKAGVAAENTSK